MVLLEGGCAAFPAAEVAFLALAAAGAAHDLVDVLFAEAVV